jgi:hypothetical protein
MQMTRAVTLYAAVEISSTSSKLQADVRSLAPALPPLRMTNG